ncbi:MAG: PQQ-binding-like beta-propeller repeat protein, partial [Limisphaerales bacterium]
MIRILLLTLVAVPAMAEDWPHWRGPDRNGISREKDWDASKMRRVWQANVGTGFSTVSVADGRVFTLGNERNRDTVYCLSENTGKGIWEHSYDSPLAPRYYDGGPSTTPTVDGDVVYTLGRQGDAFAFNAKDGKIIWQKNVAAEIDAEYPEWGYGGSPYVDGKSLILNVGKAGIKLDKQTGKIIWHTGNRTAGYSTPFTLLHRDKKTYPIFGATAVYLVQADNGKILWEHPWKT